MAKKETKKQSWQDILASMVQSGPQDAYVIVRQEGQQFHVYAHTVRPFINESQQAICDWLSNEEAGIVFDWPYLANAGYRAEFIRLDKAYAMTGVDSATEDMLDIRTDISMKPVYGSWPEPITWAVDQGKMRIPKQPSQDA